MRIAKPVGLTFSCFITFGVLFHFYKMPTLTFRLVNIINYLPLKVLFVWFLLRFRACSCLAFAACFAAASSSGAYSSNFSKSFTAPSFTVAVFSFFFSSLYKSPLSMARQFLLFVTVVYLPILFNFNDCYNSRFFLRLRALPFLFLPSFRVLSPANGLNRLAFRV